MARIALLLVAACASLTSAYSLGGAAMPALSAHRSSSTVMMKAKAPTAAEIRDAEIAKARAELEAAKAEKAAALAEKEAALKAAGKPKPKAKAPPKPKAPSKAKSNIALPNIALPKLPAFSLPSKSGGSAAPAAAAGSSNTVNIALAAGTALGLLPAGALIAARGFLESGKKYR